VRRDEIVIRLTGPYPRLPPGGAIVPHPARSIAVVHKPLHPLHAILLSGTVPLFLGVFLCDLTYSNTQEIQWKNFASWLLVGGLVFGGIALLWAAIDLSRARPRTTRGAILVALLLVLWLLGFVDALVHAADAWASMPNALVLSTIVAALALIATGLGFAGLNRGVTP
jgi:uncharacterized membrane protein